MIMTLASQSYSKSIAKGTKFPTPLTLRVSRKAETQAEKLGVLMFIAAPQVIKDSAVYYPARDRDIYFSGTTCIYVKQKYNFLEHILTAKALY